MGGLSWMGHWDHDPYLPLLSIYHGLAALSSMQSVLVYWETSGSEQQGQGIMD